MKPKIGISMGDPAELVRNHYKALALKMYNRCSPLVIGDAEVMQNE